MYLRSRTRRKSKSRLNFQLNIFLHSLVVFATIVFGNGEITIMNTNQPDEQPQKNHIALWQEDPDEEAVNPLEGFAQAGRLEGEIPIDEFISLRRAALCKAFFKAFSSLSLLITILGVFSFLSVMHPNVVSTLITFAGYIILSYQLIFRTLDTKDEFLLEELRNYLTDQPVREAIGAAAAVDTIKVSVNSRASLLSHRIVHE